ncbi:MAG TPA: hypothetical protein EYG81_01850 [Archaeoglobus profundus]|nr:hypothetical protein [Archaeoglobus profundus]
MDLAEMILTKVYEWAGLETPAWVKMRDYQDDEDVKTAKAEDIRAVIFERIAKEFEKIRYNFEYGSEIDKLTVYAIFKELSRRIPWIHVRERERDIVLLRPLISVLKDEGVKVSSLRDLTYFIPKSQYRAQIWIRGTKMSGVIVDPLEFAKWLGVISVSEEGEGDKEGEGEDKDWDLEDVLE